MGSRSRRQPATTGSGDAGSQTSGANASASPDNSFLNDLMSQANALPQQTGLDLQQASVHVDLGADTQLSDDPDLSTSARTRLWLTLGRDHLRLSCEPPLFLDLTWPLSNVAIRGFTYDFGSGAVSDVALQSTQTIAIPVNGTVRSKLGEAVQELFAGTRVAEGDYDPTQDPDFGQTLQQVITNASSSGSSADTPSPVGMGDLQSVGLSATFDVVRAIQRSTPEGEVSVASGASLTVSVLSQGSLTSAMEDPRLASLTLWTHDGVVLRKGGEDVAKLTRIRLLPGGRVDVVDFEPLGTAREVGAVESVGRLFALLAMARGSGPAGRQALANAPSDVLEPRLVDGLTESLMEDALTEVVQELIEAHHDALPGFDLRTILGMAP